MKALVGFSGTVGQNLQSQMSFSHFYHSKNIDTIKGKEFDELYLSCLPATKWQINQNPSADDSNTQHLIDILSTVKSSFVVLISTIDVYGTKDSKANERFYPLPSDTYGKNRLKFEQFILRQFKSVLIVRLPGLFGSYLKKNIIFDLLTDNNIDKINKNSSFQWYYLDRLVADIQTFKNKGTSIANFFTEPIDTANLIDAFFPTYSHLVSNNERSTSYDLTTVHMPSGYLYSKDEVMQDLALFVKRYQMTWDPMVLSNLAWDLKLTDKVVEILQSNNVNKVELALTKYGTWSELDPIKITAIKKYFDEKNIQIYSLQALTYGLSYNLFDETWIDLLIHLQKVLSYAKILGCKVVVFGSPKNRSVGPDSAYSEERATEFFRLLNQAAADNDICVCIEPNARIYSCNFLWNLEDTYFFVKRLNLSHIKMMADTGCMSLESDSINNIVLYQSEIKHIHLSEPYLKQLTNTFTDHSKLSKILQKCAIKHFSIEMVAPTDSFTVDFHREQQQLNQIYQTIHFVKTFYQDLI